MPSRPAVTRTIRLQQLWICNVCVSTIKASEIEAHLSECPGASTMTCVDCGLEFEGKLSLEHTPDVCEDPTEAVIAPDLDPDAWLQRRVDKILPADELARQHEREIEAKRAAKVKKTLAGSYDRKASVTYKYGDAYFCRNAACNTSISWTEIRSMVHAATDKSDSSLVQWTKLKCWASRSQSCLAPCPTSTC